MLEMWRKTFKIRCFVFEKIELFIKYEYTRGKLLIEQEI